VVCVREMPWPRPVAEWYEDYPEVTDPQARGILAHAADQASHGSLPDFDPAHRVRRGVLTV
jgi:hypothetical protein